MAEPAPTVKEQLKGKKAHLSGLALVVYGALDMLGIAPLDHTFMDGTGDTGAIAAGIGAGISAIRAAITKVQEVLAKVTATLEAIEGKLDVPPPEASP